MQIAADNNEEIRDLMAQLYACLDAHDADGYAARFTPDGISASPRGEFVGRAQIAEFIRAHVARGNEDGTVHSLHNARVFDDPDLGLSVSIEVMKTKVSVSPPAAMVSAFGTARVRRTDAGWRIWRYDLGHR